MMPGTTRRSVLVARVLFAAYALALFTATHWPGLRVEIGDMQRPDLLVHLLAFGGWGVLFTVSAFFGRRFSPRNVSISLAVGLVYAAVDEALQGIPVLNRFVSLDDYLANAAGIVLAAGACFAARPARRLATGRASRRDVGGTLGGGVRLVSGLTLASRVLGLVRDVLTARLFGDTAIGSAFAAALAIPNLFRRLFGEGAISAAFIPVYTRLLREGTPRADALASVTVGSVAVVTGALLLAGEAVLAAVLLTVPGDAPRAESLRLIMVTLPFMPLICVAAILGGILQVRGRFAPWAAAPIILNLCMIGVAGAATLLGVDRGSEAAFLWAAGLGGAVVLSGVIQVAWSLRALGGLVRWSRHVAAAIGEARAMLARTVPALIGLGTLQFNALADTAIAMWPNWIGPTIGGVGYPLDEASNSVLFYAQRLYQFPLGVFGIAVATVVFPELSRRADDSAGFTATLRRGVRLSLFIGLPASAGLAIVAPDLVITLFGGDGGFSGDGVTRAGSVLLGYAAAVWAYGLNQVLTRAFYALGDTTTPMRVAVGFVGLNIALNCALIWTPLREAGLAWSTAVCAVLQFVVSSRLLTLRRGTPLLDSESARSIGAIALRTCAMAAAVASLVWFWPDGETQIESALRLAAAVVSGSAVYGGLSAVTRARELRWLLR